MFSCGVFKRVDNGHLRIHLLLTHHTAHIANRLSIKMTCTNYFFPFGNFCPHGSE
jgi:hypothetical protein